MAEKVTVMVLKVDLQCSCCYKKVKKILCKFPQIRDQVYNEKANTVTITVVCCNPEKLRDKLCCKGCKVIKSIEIVEKSETPKPKPTPTPAPAPKPKPAPDPAPKPAPAPAPKPAPAPAPAPKPAPEPAPKPAPAPAPAPKPKPPPPEPTMGPCPVPVPAFPVRTCCGSCYEGHGGGPCYQGYGVPPPPPPPPQPSFDGYYGYGCDRPCHVSRCDYYFSEENPQSCAIM